MMTLIKNASAVLADGVLENAFLLIEDGVIVKVGRDSSAADIVIDAEGAWVLPGFIDLHCHGGAGYEFMDATGEEIEKILDFHLSHGTTTMLATTLAASDKETESALGAISEYIGQNARSVIAGIHLEGPHFNPVQCGAQNPEHIRAMTVAELRALKAAYPDILRVSAAPEIGDGLALGDEGKRLGILMSAGHTDANFGEIEAAASHGYRLMTHLYSGMSGVVRKNSFRIAGAVEAGLYLDEMFVEIIADGCHLPIELLRYIYKFKGCDRVCLITDAIRAAGMKDGERSKIGSMAAGLDVIVEDGVAKLPDRQSFAGSTATADRLFRNMMLATGGDVVAVSKMASGTPAGLMGWSDRGEIAESKLADLVIMDKNYNIKTVIFKGKKI